MYEYILAFKGHKQKSIINLALRVSEKIIIICTVYLFPVMGLRGTILMWFLPFEQ